MSPRRSIAVYQQPGANGLTVSEGRPRDAGGDEVAFPEGMDYLISLDTNDFVRLSIKEVIKTLFEAIVLVVLVVYLFLQSFRTTIICTVAIFVALIATFAGMLALGFSINLLTLFGLVLAIGMVVDDAIVVVENVERNMAQHHLPPKEATIRSMEEIATLAHRRRAGDVHRCSSRRRSCPGTTGQLYKQFAITIVDLGVGLGLRRADADAGDVRADAEAHPAAASADSSPGSTARSTTSPPRFGHAVVWVIERMAHRARAARRLPRGRSGSSSTCCRRASSRTKTRAT